MKKEIEYYEKILELYEKKEKGLIPPEKARKISDLSLVELMEKLRNKEHPVDADISHVVKNSIILMLGLFDESYIPPDHLQTPLDSLPDEERKAIKKDLLKIIE